MSLSIVGDLQAFEEKQAERGDRIPIALTLYNINTAGKGTGSGDHEDNVRYQGLNTLYRDLQTRYAILEGTNAQLQEANTGLETQLREANEAYGVLQARFSATETEYLKHLEEIEAQHPSFVTEANAANLEAVLQQNQDAYGAAIAALTEGYTTAQEMATLQAFAELMAQLDQKAIVIETDEILKARKELAERDAYLIEHGQDAFEKLPDTIRQVAHETYSLAERVVAEYEALRSARGSMEIPMHILRAKDGTTRVIIPVNPESQSDAAILVYDTLSRYAGRLQTEHNLVYSLETCGPGCATLQIESTDRLQLSYLAETLVDAFSGIAKFGITVKPIQTTQYVGPGAETEKAEEDIPAQQPETLAEFAQQIMSEHGWTNAAAAAKATGISAITFTRMLAGKTNSLKPNTVKKLTEALDWPEERITSIWKS